MFEIPALCAWCAGALRLPWCAYALMEGCESCKTFYLNCFPSLLPILCIGSSSLSQLSFAYFSTLNTINHKYVHHLIQTLGLHLASSTWLGRVLVTDYYLGDHYFQRRINDPDSDKQNTWLNHTRRYQCHSVRDPNLGPTRAKLSNYLSTFLELCASFSIPVGSCDTVFLRIVPGNWCGTVLFPAP